MTMALMAQPYQHKQQLQRDVGPSAVEEPPLVSLPQSVLTTLMWHVVGVSNPGQVAKMAMVSRALQMPQQLHLTGRRRRFGGTWPRGKPVRA